MRSIIQILNSIRPLSRQNKIHVLRGLIACEKKRSFRSRELLAILKPILNLEIKVETRQDKREKAA